MSHMYRSLLVVPALILLHLASSSAISQDKSYVKFEVPSSSISLILLDDPGCPLKLSGPEKVIGYSDGGLSRGYTITNRSGSDIASLETQEIDWFGKARLIGGAPTGPGFIFYPGFDFYTLHSDDTEDLVPFDGSSESTKNVLKTSNRYWAVMVVKVKLSDGTTYDASKKFEALEKFARANWDYFDDRFPGPQVDTEALRIAINTKGMEFRTFLDKLQKQKN